MEKRKPFLKKKSIVDTSSHSGYHFYNLHQNCQRKFYIKFVCRLSTTHVAPPLIQGSAFHEAKEVFYKTGSKRKAISTAMSYVKENQSFIEDPDAYAQIEYRIPIMVLAWIEKFGIYDLKQYKFLAIERQFNIKLPPVAGYPAITVTVKPDAIVQDKYSKDIYIMETKTSGFSMDLTNNGVKYGDQATTYIYAVEKVMKKKVYGVIPDILYWNSRAKGENTLLPIRGDIVMRKDRDLEVWEKSVRQEFLEISQKVQAVKNGYDPDALFRRNTFYCMSYSKLCEFADICRANLTPKTTIPYGYARYKRKRNANPGTLTTDNIIGLS